jgi:hypothetical protein
MAIGRALQFLAEKVVSDPDISSYAQEVRSSQTALAFLKWSASDALEGMANLLTSVARATTASAGLPSVSAGDIDQAMKESGVGTANLTENPSALTSVARSLKCRYLVFGKIEAEGEQVRLTTSLFDRKLQSVVNSVTRKERMDDLPALQEAVRGMILEMNRSRNIP